MCWLAYVAAAAAGIWSLHATASYFPGIDPLANGLIATLCATTVVFAFSFVTRNTSVYDPYWVLAPCGLVLYWTSLNPEPLTWFQRAGLILMFTWATRHMVALPWAGWTRGLDQEDWRYLHIREKLGSASWAYWPVSYLSLHVTPTLLVFMGVAPLGRILVTSEAPPSDAFTQLSLVAAVAFTTLAIVIEATADAQLQRFRSQAQSHQEVLRSGLWAYSRHPNYFGECCFWIGLVCMAIAAGCVGLTREPWLVSGAISMCAFFRFGTIPLMDARSLARRPGYDEVIKSTSAMLPWPRSR
jgi:steroid 5-alpha reductase family enzyme